MIVIVLYIFDISLQNTTFNIIFYSPNVIQAAPIRIFFLFNGLFFHTFFVVVNLSFSG